jgi:two-component system CitB family sensor kinase
MSLRVQLVVLQALIVLVATVLTGAIAASLHATAIREAYKDRLIGVAQSMARLPAVVDALDDPEPASVVQPIAEVIRKASDVTYVVVTDADGIRLSHPDPARIGERVSTDPSIPLAGQTFVGTQRGTLGESWRVKVPIFQPGTHIVIGTVSVGVLESQLSSDFLEGVPWLLLAMAVSAVIGVFGAAWVTSIVRRRIFRLEPAEIATLVDQRETMLHRIGEGVVTVRADGVITVVNDAAERLLGRSDLVGHRADDVLEPTLLDVLHRGEPEGELVLVGERVLIARSTGARLDGAAVDATLLIRDHTELHAALREMDGAHSLTEGLRAQAHEFANTMHVVSWLLESGDRDEALDYIASVTGGGTMAGGRAELLGEPELAALLAVKTAQARELGITLEVDDATGGADLPKGIGHDLVTLVGNVVDNAMEACGMGDRIRVRAEQAAAPDGSPRLRLLVDDDGPGVPAADRERVFESGVSTKAVTASGPHRRGIGLALVQRVARRRGGSAVVEESPLGGARVRIELPLPAIAASGARP